MFDDVARLSWVLIWHECGCHWAFKYRWQTMAQLLLGDSCTVTIAHSRTKDLPVVVRGADIVVAAVGRPEMVPATGLNRAQP